MAIAHSRRNHFWFGTEEVMQWLPTPNSGADVTGQGWEAGGTLLNGGGYQFNSTVTHGHYIYEWPPSTPQRVSQIIKSYRDGSYGKGLIYFIDPLVFEMNILPPYWADPSMAIGDEGVGLVYGVDPTGTPTTNRSANDLPVTSAVYNLSSTPVGWRGKEDAVFLPVPEGYTLFLGAIYSATGTGAVRYRTQAKTGALQAEATLPQSAVDDSIIHTRSVGGSDVAGVWLYVARTSSAASTVTISAMSARLIPTDKVGTPKETEVRSGPWVGGQGHSGCRFVGNPTIVKHTGIGGGQVGFAATFREVGHWAHG